MTYQRPNSAMPAPRAPVAGHSYSHALSSADSTAPQALEPSPPAEPLVAANDDDDDSPRRIPNPLRVIVTALVVLFTVMALIVALG